MSNTTGLKYQRRTPAGQLTDFVDSFWSLENPADTDKVVTILPDGYFDVLFTSTNGMPFKAILYGFSTKQFDCTVAANSRTFSISFKLIAAEFVLKQTIAHLRDAFEYLPEDSEWYNCIVTPSLDGFVTAAAQFIEDRIHVGTEDKKLFLSREIYGSRGAITIKHISATTSWKCRQINRYFQHFFGLPLKAYCGILRFRASFDQINNGQLFPDDNFYDQAHFIREVNKFSGTTPKQLAKNADDRFIQFSTLATP